MKPFGCSDFLYELILSLPPLLLFESNEALFVSDSVLDLYEVVLNLFFIWLSGLSWEPCWLRLPGVDLDSGVESKRGTA